jgi:Fe-S-cluster containining protein
MKRQPLPVVTDCRNCGACCTEQSGLPVSWYLGGAFPLGERLKLPPALLAEMQAILDGWLVNGFPADNAPCVWYNAETRQCAHHDNRPEICREFEIGEKSCLDWRRRKGIDQGKLVEVP